MTNVCFKNGILKAYSFFRTWLKNTGNRKLKPESHTHPSGVGFAMEMTGVVDGGGEAMSKWKWKDASQAKAEEKPGIYGILRA